MTFVQGYYIPKSEELINNAFSYGRKQADYVKAEDKETLVKHKERTRMKYSAEYIQGIYSKIVKTFPSVNDLSDFYRHMVQNSTDIGKVKKALAHVQSANQMIERLKSDYLILVTRRHYSEAGRVRNEFYGRVKSVIKKTQKSLDIVKEGYIAIKSIPYVRELPTVILVGLPNVGKSTLLNQVTGANVEIKNYPFTTKKLQVGMIKHKYLDFQIIDSPGLLDRSEDDQNPIEKQTVIAIKSLGTSMLFIIDVTQNQKQQLNVVNRYVNSNLPHIIVFSKVDLITSEDLDEFREEFMMGMKLKKNTKNKELDTILELNLAGGISSDDMDKLKDLIYKQNKEHYKQPKKEVIKGF